MGKEANCWSETIGGSNSEKFSSVKQTDDGGYIISGTISTGGQGSNMYLVKTNASGKVSWKSNMEKAVRRMLTELVLWLLRQRGLCPDWFDHGFGAGATDVYVIKTDANGVKDQSWGDKTFGGEHRDGDQK